jgi:ribosomal protein L11 methyltransferase
VEWFEIRVTVDGERKEAVSNRLFELGARGVSDTDSGKESSLVGYFDGKSAPGALREIGSYLESLSLLFKIPAFKKPELAPVADSNWVDLHKEFYKAQKLSSHFFLLPAWDKETAVPPGMAPIVLELGQAFGTGLHPSTQLAMHLMERVLNAAGDIAAWNLIDVGTGTGILAIVGEKLGVTRIEAMDIDPIAIECAEENLKLNGCRHIHVFTGELSQVKEPANVIVSNILLEVHVGLVESYRRLLKDGGWIILSGLLTHQLPEVETLMTAGGFVREETQSNGEWAAACYRRT